MQIKNLKILIIKTGYSETLDPEVSANKPSLGDVLRSTVILHAKKLQGDVTWLTDLSAYPLLKGNPKIHRILFWDLNSAMQLLLERFDIVVNLEKTPGLSALATMIHAWQKYGFRFGESGTDAFYETINPFKIYTDHSKKKDAGRCWQDVLFEMVGEKWNGEEYVSTPAMQEPSDYIPKIGFNHKIGGKWPNKGWSMENWQRLSSLVGDSGTWQYGDTLDDYIKWARFCRVIVTNDSLGLHLAIAMGKKIVALFGPTNPDEVFLYGLGEKIVAKNGDMSEIKPEVVFRAVQNLLA